MRKRRFKSRFYADLPLLRVVASETRRTAVPAVFQRAVRIQEKCGTGRARHPFDGCRRTVATVTGGSPSGAVWMEGGEMFSRRQWVKIFAVSSVGIAMIDMNQMALDSVRIMGGSFEKANVRVRR